MRFGASMREIVKTGLLPTPNAAEGYKAAKTYNPNSQMGSSLSAMAGSGMLPTPTCNDANNLNLPISQIKRNDSIVKRILIVNPQAGISSQLNPRFVGEMMGFPVNWTELPFLSGERKVSKPMEMP
jgi:hypothetical protein